QHGRILGATCGNCLDEGKVGDHSALAVRVHCASWSRSAGQCGAEEGRLPAEPGGRDSELFTNISQINQPSKPQMLKTNVIWLIGTDGLGHNEFSSCVPNRRTMPINQMTPTAYPDRRQRCPFYKARVSTLNGQWAELFTLTLSEGLRTMTPEHKDSNSRSSGVGIYIPEHGSQQAIYFSSHLTGNEQNIDRAEIQAAITAVKMTNVLPSIYDDVIIRTDSLNLITFVQDWEKMWSRDKNWSQIQDQIEKKLNDSLSENYYFAGKWIKYKIDFEELFKELITLKNSGEVSSVQWLKVESHSGDDGNDKSDYLAKYGRKLLYDNKQLFESLKSFFLQKNTKHHFNKNKENLTTTKTNKINLIPNTKNNVNFPHLVEVTQVPVHISTITVIEAMKVKSQNFVKEKVNDYCQADRTIIFRISKEAFYNCMKLRKLKLDDYIEVPVNPCIDQCSLCLKLKHIKKNCPNNIPRCSKCAQQNHNFKDCTTSLNAGPVCANCADQKRDDKHPVFSNQCPLREEAQNELAKKTYN
ncbi:Ribonuclease H1, partial [Tyrophagus putrescentiae]